jgi:PelA/Pel-15E family pectate lyase
MLCFYPSKKIKILFLTIFLLASFYSLAQKNTNANSSSVNMSSFEDSRHHWYDIFDKSNVVNAKPNQSTYKNTDVTAIGDNILLYQKDNGGWPKNYDMLAILTPAQKDSLIKAKNILNTTFDNSTTYTHIAALASIYYATKLERFKAAALKGIEFILSAQYKNGGWPQYYPLESNYSKEITLNDDAYIGIMWLLKDIKENKKEYDFVDNERRKKVITSYEKGLQCILKTQINDAGKPTAWCQQYDEKTLQPAWARAFEPPSICNGESAGVIKFLMSIDHPLKQVIDAVENAVAWFNDSKILNTRIKTVSAPDTVYRFRRSHTDKIVVNDPSAPPIWTRYYELKTHRPLFCNRDSKVVYSLAEVERERRDGYGWYTYEPQKVLNNYAAWKKKWVK